MMKLKNILAENLLRFGVKNLSESDRSRLKLTEDTIDQRDWANKQSAALKNLDTQYYAEKFPITPVVIGPYCLTQIQNIAQQSAEKIAEGSNYQGDIVGWTTRLGLPSLQTLTNNDVGFFSYHPSNKFQQFSVNNDAPIEKSTKGLNMGYDQLPLATIQQMWKNINSSGLYTKRMNVWKPNVLAYQANPTDATKGYNTITGNAAAFLKSLKFA